MIIMFINGLLLACLATLGYAWVFYPFVLGIAARKQRGATAPAASAEESLPLVTVILSAHNEESVIEDRLKNLQSLDYPADRLSVRVGVDGGTDRTGEIAREVAARDARLAVRAFDENRGKVAVLKDLVGAVGACDVLVFTDANTRFEKDAILKLMSYFRDPLIGGVCGRLVFTAGSPFASDDGAQNSSPEDAYWRWETLLKNQESRLDSCLGANGAIYAIRRSLFWGGIPASTIIDDFVIGMKVREQGGRMIYAPEVVAYEELPEPASEWGRRVRIGAGDYQALAICRRCLLPRYGVFARSFLSHKVLRWFTPQLVLIATVTAALGLFLGNRPVLRVVQVGVLAGLAGGMLCVLVDRVRPGLAVIAHISHLVSMQAALMMGFVRFLRGNLRGTWSRTPRGISRRC